MMKATLTGLMVCAGMAMAQSEPAVVWAEAEPLAVDSENVARVIELRRDGAQPESENIRSIEISINGEDVTAVVNGERIPANRIIREGDSILILDKSGKVMWSNEGGMTPPAPSRPGLLRAAPEAGEIAILREVQPEAVDIVEGFPLPVVQPPRFVIGVTISEADSVLLEHLGLESALRVDSVMDDRPAKAAGMKAGDLIVSLDGAPGVTLEVLRDVLAESGGESGVRFGIVRRGEKSTLKITPVPNVVEGVFVDAQVEREVAAAQAAEMESAVSALRRAIIERRLMGDENRAEFEDELAQMERALADMMVELDRQRAMVAEEKAQIELRRRFPGGGSGTGGFIVAPDGDRELVITRPGQAWTAVPDAPGAVGVFGGRAESGAMSRLEDRMERIEDRLARIETLLLRALDR